MSRIDAIVVYVVRVHCAHILTNGFLIWERKSKIVLPCPSREEKFPLWILTDHGLVRAQILSRMELGLVNFFQDMYANALARFRRLQILDLCASVTFLHRLSVNGCDILRHEHFCCVNERRIPETVSLPNVDEIMTIQRRATLHIVAKCPNLRIVVWNASGWAEECSRLNTVWVWRIDNSQDDGYHRYSELDPGAERTQFEVRLPRRRSAVCEGKQKRYSSCLSTLFRDMRSLE